VNNQWTLCSKKLFKKSLKLKKDRLELILIRLIYLDTDNIRNIKASICEKLTQNSLNGTQNTSGEIIDQEIELTEQIGKTCEIALSHTKHKSEINHWYYIAIDLNVFESSYKINKIEPHISKNYGIQLVSNLDQLSEPPIHVINHFEKLINDNNAQTKKYSKSKIYRLFRKR